MIADQTEPNRANPASRGPAIYVDHGEAYGNMGEEAMILNALARLDRCFQPRTFYITHPSDSPLPVSHLSRAVDVPSPFRVFYDQVQQLEKSAQRLRALPLIGRLVPAAGSSFYWQLAVALDRWLPAVLKLRDREDMRQFFRALDDSAFYYHVGMSGLNEFWEPGLIYKEWVLREARRRTRLVVLSSQGFGPVSRPRARRLLKRLLRHVHITSLRDNAFGAQLLREFNLSGLAFKIVFDEAFSFQAAADSVAREWLARASLPAGDDFVAFHYRAKDYTPGALVSLARLANIARIIRQETRARVLFIPMSYAEHSCVDEELGLALQTSLGQPDWFHVLAECREVSVIKAIIGLAKFSVGLSYHTTVFSLTQGHPALVLYTGGYYQLKSDGLVGFYGAPSRALDLATVGDADIASAIRGVLADYPRACEHIKSVNERLARVNDWTLEEIKRRLEADPAKI